MFCREDTIHGYQQRVVERITVDSFNGPMKNLIISKVNAKDHTLKREQDNRSCKGCCFNFFLYCCNLCSFVVNVIKFLKTVKMRSVVDVNVMNSTWRP